ncbi:MAG: CHAT domain-containing tetratricopeptide repeat protein [Acidobacteriota bacterium]
MTVEISINIDQLAQEILAAADIKRFIIERAASLDVNDVARLRAVVDHLVSKDFHMASRLAEAVWEIGQWLGDDASRAYGEAARGRVEYCVGRYSQAFSHYERALTLMEKIGKPIEVAILQKQQLGALMYLGKHREAILLAARARRVLKTKGEQAQWAELETNIGNLHCYLLEQYRKSLRYYERARNIFIELGNEVSLARVDFNIANALTKLDRIDEALTIYQRASQIWRRHEMPVYAGLAEYNIAYLLFRRGQFNEALNYYYQVRENQQGLGDEVSVAWCNMDMAEIYLQLSVFEESARLAALAQTSFLKSENTFQAAWAQTLGGLALAGLGQLDAARRELSAALEQFSRQSSRVMVGLLHTYLAELELKAGNYQTALANSREAEEIFLKQRLPVKVAFAQLVLAKIAYHTGNLVRARALLRGVQQKAQKHAIAWLEYECYYLYGCLHETVGERELALTQFARAIDMVGAIRSYLSADELKSAFLRDKMNLFERAIELSLMLPGDAACALSYIEQAKSRSLADLLAHYVERELTEQLARPELRERFLMLLNEQNWYSSAAQWSREEENLTKRPRNSYLKERRIRCEQELTEIFRRIQIEHANYANLQQPATVELAQLQQLLAPDEAIIEYFASRKQGVSAFIITKERVLTRHNLISEAKIEELLESFQFQLGKFSLQPNYISKFLPLLEESAKRDLQQLYTHLIGPLATEIRGRSLAIVPHGLLHYVPFHALHNGECYLVERHTISYAPSITVYALCRQKETASAGPLLIFGLPDKAAPEIASEVNTLATLYPDTRVFIEAEASLANLKRYGPECRILHLATHGVVRSDNPLFSYLKLADGRLSFYNTFDLKLQAELVTLSACHTGINRIFPGDELHGLMRGFLYAGTPAMVVSLWEADDRATRELMTRFYQHLLAGECKRDALCAAQRELLAHHPHPYYWASFILFGKP